jgi:hypothetical protein
MIRRMTKVVAGRRTGHSNGYRACLEAIEGAIDNAMDYAMLVKTYCESPEAEKRYRLCGRARNAAEGQSRGND